MSEEIKAPEAEQKTEFKPIESQDELNKLIGERIGKVKAQFADYEDLKAKAVKFDEVEQASKTELEKAQERIKQLEQSTTEAQRAALRTRVAAEMNVPVEVLQGDDEETVRAAAQRVLDWAAQGKKPAPKPTSLRSGSSGNAPTGEGRAAAALRQLRQG